VTSIALRAETVADAWEILDMQGRRLMSGHMLAGGETIIPVGNLPAGTYYCHVYGDTGRSVVSFVKQ
jgi:hypothetical protein